MMQSLRGIATSFPSYARPCRNFSLSFTLSSPKRSPGAVLIGVTATQQRPLAGPSLLYLYIPPDHTIGFETASRGIIERPFSLSLSLSLSSLSSQSVTSHAHTNHTVNVQRRFQVGLTATTTSQADRSLFFQSYRPVDELLSLSLTKSESKFAVVSSAVF